MSRRPSATGYRREAWRTGNRVLLAKSCPDCGQLLPADQFGRDRHGWNSYCRRCKVLRVRKSPSHNDSAYLYRKMKASRKVIQDFTRTHAHRHGEPWIESDHVVLSDPKLSLVEKALKLGRTYIAVVNLVVLHGYESKPVDDYADEIDRLTPAESA